MNFNQYVVGSDGSGKYGDGVISFNGGGNCGNYWADSAYAHSALAVKITGWSLSFYGISASFSGGSSNGWTLASDASSNSVYTC